MSSAERRVVHGEDDRGEPLGEPEPPPSRPSMTKGNSTTNTVPSSAPSSDPRPPMITMATYWMVRNSENASAETKPR